MALWALSLRKTWLLWAAAGKGKRALYLLWSCDLGYLGQNPERINCILINFALHQWHQWCSVLHTWMFSVASMMFSVASMMFSVAPMASMIAVSCPVLHSMWVVWMQLPPPTSNWTSHRMHRWSSCEKNNFELALPGVPNKPGDMVHLMVKHCTCKKHGF